MSILYENISKLCKERDISGYKLCTDLHLSKSILTDLKMGRKKSISAETASKIANYFNVSVDYLLGKETSTSVENINNPLLDRIRDLCSKNDLTLVSLEKKLGFGYATFMNWNKSSPTADKLQKVADYFGVSVDYLLGRENTKQEDVELENAFFRLKKGLEPYNLSKSDTDFILTVFKAHKEKNK